MFCVVVSTVLSQNFQGLLICNSVTNTLTYFVAKLTSFAAALFAFQNGSHILIHDTQDLLIYLERRKCSNPRFNSDFLNVPLSSLHRSFKNTTNLSRETPERNLTTQY